MSKQPDNSVLLLQDSDPLVVKVSSLAAVYDQAEPILHGIIDKSSAEDRMNKVRSIQELVANTRAQITADTNGIAPAELFTGLVALKAALDAKKLATAAGAVDTFSAAYGKFLHDLKNIQAALSMLKAAKELYFVIGLVRQSTPTDQPISAVLEAPAKPAKAESKS